jgi:hypothetical protein
MTGLIIGLAGLLLIAAIVAVLAAAFARPPPPRPRRPKTPRLSRQLALGRLEDAMARAEAKHADLPTDPAQGDTNR